MAGLAALGLRAGFIGQVANDQLGEIFAHDMTSLGVTFETAPLTGGPPTGRCLILVTPDAQRTMNTCPGASHQLEPDALDEALIASASILYLEGYLWGPELPRRAMHKAIEIARAAGRKVAFTLSESVCSAGRREGFSQMIDSGGVDLLFANEDEALQLTGARDFGEALAMLAAKVPTLVITRGAKGALALEEGVRVEVPWVEREPAAIIRDNFRVTMQPFDAPSDAKSVEEIIDQIGSEKMFLFASDYPHWQFDGDDPIPPNLPKGIIAKMCVDNPLETFPRLSLAN